MRAWEEQEDFGRAGGGGEGGAGEEVGRTAEKKKKSAKDERTRAKISRVVGGGERLEKGELGRI